MTLPKKITAGDTLNFTESVADYKPADGWALSYALVNASSKIDITSSDNGDGTHLVDQTAAQTVAWITGTYRWQSYVTKAPERHTIARGEIVIRPDFATQTGGVDGRGTWQTILDNLETAYKTLTTTSATVVSVSFGDRSTTYRNANDLITAISHARAQVRREQQKADLADGIEPRNRLHFRF